MKTAGPAILFALFSISCQSAEKSTDEAPDSVIFNFPNLISAQAPDRTDILNVPVYVDHVEILIINQSPFVLIQGNLPTPCYNLNTPEENIQNGNLNLILYAWQPLDTICTQVLQPFSFLHPLPESADPASSGNIFINNIPYEL